jgi:hypothetical protein
MKCFIIIVHTNLKASNLGSYKVKKGKGVPLHAMEAHGERGGIAPTHT